MYPKTTTPRRPCPTCSERAGRAVTRPPATAGSDVCLYCGGALAAVSPPAPVKAPAPSLFGDAGHVLASPAVRRAGGEP